MTTVKRLVPASVKRIGRSGHELVGLATASHRLVPSFLLAGGQRCGTTSLYRALLAHPAVLSAAFHKGVNYFDVNYHRGWQWYRAHFPLRGVANARVRAHEPPQTFDASGYYMFHPWAAERIGRDLPDAKVIVLLRDPVERAFSAYKHEFARGFETETFDKALLLEDQRVEPELKRMLDDPNYHSSTYRHQAYRRRGEYAPQLLRLIDALGRDSLLVVESEHFFTEPEKQYDRITAFLGLSAYRPDSFDRWNARPGSEVSDFARSYLHDAYRRHDEALVPILGHAPGWQR